MEEYQTDWRTDFYTGLDPVESEVFGLYTNTVDSYLSSMVFDFGVPDNLVGIEDIEELEARMEPIIEKLNRQLELQFGDETH